MLVFIQLATMNAGSSFPPILGFHVTSEKTKIKNFEFLPLSVKVIVKHISVGLSSAR